MLFQPDYIIAWDFSDKDAPAVGISKLYSDGKSMHLMVDVLDTFHTETGVVSVRQLVEEFERREHGKHSENLEGPIHREGF